MKFKITHTETNHNIFEVKRVIKDFEYSNKTNVCYIAHDIVTDNRRYIAPYNILPLTTKLPFHDYETTDDYFQYQCKLCKTVKRNKTDEPCLLKVFPLYADLTVLNGAFK